MRNLTNQEIAAFCEELAWLIHSGVRVGDGLMLLAEEEQDKEWKECLLRMAGQSDEGIFLSEILKNENCFPVYVHGIVKVGENSGRMEEALKALTRYYENKERMNRRIKGALLYPSILLLLMLVVLVILLTQVLPVFQSVFASLGGGLDGVAGGLLNLGLWLNEAMPVLCVILGIAILFIFAVSVSDVVREKIMSLWRKVSGDRGIMRKMNDAGFAQAISMGLSSGLPLEETMELAAEVLSDVPEAKQRCMICKEELQKGIPLIDALKTSEVLPLSACRLLSLGMQSGNGDVVMAEIAEKLSEEADIAMENRVAKVEPTMVLVTSVLVGMILLLVMMPLMNIMETIG